MIRDAQRLRATLGRTELGRLIERLRERLERGEALDGTITIRDATAAEREAVAGLFGRAPSRGASITVRLDALADVLRRAEICETLEEAVAALGGPVINRRAQRDELDDAWQRVLDAGAVAIPADGWRSWLAQLRTSGLLRRVASNDPRAGARLLEQAAMLFARLPASAVPIAEMAAAVAGDSHALDVGAPLATIGVRLAAAFGGLSGWESSEERRDAWAAAGVMCDELSAPVLVLGLPVAGDSPSDRAIRLHAEAGEPYRLSVRQLMRGAVTLAADLRGRRVFVCENPTVVAAAADRLGAACPPLLCTDGQLKTAARLLLQGLCAAGAALHYHGDFDWGGVRIANTVIGRFGALPWRMSTPDYLALPALRELDGQAVDACWDPALRGAMVARGRAIHEEQLLDTLIADLRQGGG